MTEPNEGVNAFSSVDRLNGDQHAHLRGDLNHRSTSRQTRNKLAQSGGAAAFHWMRILPPPGDSNSMTQPSSTAERGATSSTKAGLGAFLRRVAGPPSRFFSRMLSSRSGWATGYTPCCRANSTAACHNGSGSFVRFGRVLRNCSSWRCSCRIGSGIGSALLRFTSRAAPSATECELNRADYAASRILPGNSPSIPCATLPTSLTS